MFSLNVFIGRWMSITNHHRFIEDEIIHFKSKKTDEFSYPIIKHLNSETMNNLDVLGNLRFLIAEGAAQDINYVNLLFYGKDYNPEITYNKPTELAKRLNNSIENLA